MSFVVHTIETAPPPARELLREARGIFGFLPNLLGELADAPVALEAYLTLNRLLGATSLSPQAQQVVVAAVSVANECGYCVAAHSAGLKMAGLADDQIAAVREDRPLADPALEAVRAFATAVVSRRGWANADLQRFLDAGFTRAQALEVLVGVAMKTLSNYTNHLADTPLDEALAPFAWRATAHAE